VDWLLHALRRRPRPAAPTCYLRENGPIAYALPLFADDARPRLEAMLDTGLSWFWQSARDASAPGEWTSLSRWSLAALLADLGGEDGARRDLWMIGLEAADAPRVLHDRDVASMLRAFVAEERGALEAVIHHVPPDACYAFVAQQASAPVVALLQAWDADPTKAVRKAYARLPSTSLEQWMRALGRG
jgi:hypothetical protein